MSKKVEVQRFYVYITEMFEDPSYLKYQAGWLEVDKVWLRKKVKTLGFKSIPNFLNNYDYDMVCGWYKDALEDKAIKRFGYGSEVYGTSVTFEI